MVGLIRRAVGARGFASSALSGKCAVITGGGTGIGFEIARVLAGEGADVVLVGRRLEQLRVAAAEIERARVLSVDVTDDAEVAAMYATHLQSVQILVNCAGIAPPATPTLGELDINVLREALAINLVAPALLVKEGLRAQALGRGSRVVNIASVAAISPRPGTIPYSVSKAALVALSRSLALDGREVGLDVTCVLPGNVETPILTREEVARREAAEGFVRVEDVAETVRSACCMPAGVSISETIVMPTRQPLVGRG